MKKITLTNLQPKRIFEVAQSSISKDAARPLLQYAKATPINQIITGDALAVLQTLPAESVNTCVTSPPYYGLRDYGVAGQIGLEQTPNQYIQRLADVFSEVKRVLRNDGTLWINIADSYFPHNGSRGNKSFSGDSLRGRENTYQPAPKIFAENIKGKDLIGVPWLLAFALREAGWYLRQEIIWAKPNPMPESVNDRCTKSHESLFLLAKSPKYYFDADLIREPLSKSRAKQAGQKVSPGNNTELRKSVIEHDLKRGSGGHFADRHKWFLNPLGKNKRDVWTVSTKSYKGAHFATFPVDLIEPCILAGCPADGIVLDPFCGSGTVGVAAVKNSRNYIGIDLNPQYSELAEKRIADSDKDVDE